MIKNIGYASDLHLEHPVNLLRFYNTINKPSFKKTLDMYDLFIFAGDNHLTPRAIEELEKVGLDLDKTIIIHGNHDFMVNQTKGLSDVVRYNEATFFEFENVNIAAATGWYTIDDIIFSDLSKKIPWYDEETKNKVRAKFPLLDLSSERDFALFAINYTMYETRCEGLLAKDIVKLGQDHYDFFLNKCIHSRTWFPEKKLICLSHHLPTPKAIDKFFKNKINAGFVNNMLDLFDDKYAPDYWIHGHSHSKFRRKIGNTIVARNPRNRNLPVNFFAKIEL